MVLLLGGIAYWLFGYINHALHFEETDDAFVAGHLHQVGARIAGTVQEVLVSDNQSVQAGEPLLRLDPLEFEIAAQKSRADLDHARATETQAHASESQAKAQANQAQAEVRQAEAKIAQSEALLQVAKLNKVRNEALYSNHDGAVAKVEVDTTIGSFDAATAALDGAKASLDAAKAGLIAAQSAAESAASQAVAAQASVAEGQVAVRDAERLLSYTTIYAPATGRIGAKNVETGNRLQPGQAVLSLSEGDIWVVANFKETQLARMKPQQAVEITLDVLPGHKFTGRVESLAPASGAQYALLPPDNATGNFTKVVQRVPVKIIFDPASISDYKDRIRPGLSAIVNVSVR